MSDGSIIESELGHDPINGWALSPNIEQVEFEDGTVLVNPDFVGLELCIRPSGPHPCPNRRI